MAQPRTTVEFTPAIAPEGVQVVGAVARGANVQRWLQRLAAEPDASLRPLQAAMSTEVLVVLGESLPWIDGLTYLRACDGDTTLLLPCTMSMSVPEALFARSLRAKYAGRIAVLPDTREVMSLAHATPLSHEALEEVLR